MIAGSRLARKRPRVAWASRASCTGRSASAFGRLTGGGQSLSAVTKMPRRLDAVQR